MNKKLEKDENNIFQNKYFTYPIGSISSVIIMCTVIGITIYIYRACKACKNTTPPSS